MCSLLESLRLSLPLPFVEHFFQWTLTVNAPDDDCSFTDFIRFFCVGLQGGECPARDPLSRFPEHSSDDPLLLLPYLFLDLRMSAKSIF
jgi:hypothetical protein